RTGTTTHCLSLHDALPIWDFETLVDLIFARGGWQRSSALGKHQPDVDLILTQPTTDETAWVQIKSKASQAELNDYLGRFRRDGRDRKSTRLNSSHQITSYA